MRGQKAHEPMTPIYMTQNRCRRVEAEASGMMDRVRLFTVGQGSSCGVLLGESRSTGWRSSQIQADPGWKERSRASGQALHGGRSRLIAVDQGRRRAVYGSSFAERFGEWVVDSGCQGRSNRIQVNSSWREWAASEDSRRPRGAIQADPSRSRLFSDGRVAGRSRAQLSEKVGHSGGDPG